MAFGKRKDVETQKNVPVYTTDQVIVPDGYKAEYAGLVHFIIDAVKVKEAVEQFQSYVNQSGVDAVCGMKMETTNTAMNTHKLVLYGTGINFVPV